MLLLFKFYKTISIFANQNAYDTVAVKKANSYVIWQPFAGSKF